MAGGPPPRSIERGWLERRRRGRTTIEFEFRHRLDGPSLSSAVHSQSSGAGAGTETEVTAKARWRGRSHAQFGLFTSAGLDPGQGDVAHGLPCMEFVEDVTTLGNTGTGLRG